MDSVLFEDRLDTMTTVARVNRKLTPLSVDLRSVPGMCRVERLGVPGLCLVGTWNWAGKRCKWLINSTSSD